MSDKKPENKKNEILGSVGSAIVAFLLIWHFHGGGTQKKDDDDIQDINEEINKKMAQDAAAKYQIAKKNGSRLDACTEAQSAAGISLYIKDEESYKKWKRVEKVDCDDADAEKPNDKPADMVLNSSAQENSRNLYQEDESLPHDKFSDAAKSAEAALTSNIAPIIAKYEAAKNNGDHAKMCDFAFGVAKDELSAKQTLDPMSESPAFIGARNRFQRNYEFWNEIQKHDCRAIGAPRADAF